MRTLSKNWTTVALIVGGASLAACGATSTAAPTAQPTTTTSEVSSAPSRSATATSGPSESPRAAATESNPPGDIPDNQAFVPFTPPGSKVSVKVPEGWARSMSGTVTLFSDKLNRIQIAPTSAASAPTASAVTRSDVTKLQSTVSKFTPGKVTVERRTAGSVILVTYQGDSPQDPVTGKVVRDAFERYIYYHNGRRLDLTLSGPTNADNVDPWRIVSDSVRWR